MRKGLRRTAAVGVAGVFLGAGLATSAEVAQPEAMDDFAYHWNDGDRDPKYAAVETKMTEVINKRFETDVRVRCADPVSDSKTKFTPKDVKGNTHAVSSTQDIWFSPSDRRYVRIAPELCGLIAVTGEVEPAANKQLLTGVAYSLSALVFQAEHAKHEGEGRTDGELTCYTIQETAAVAMDMGAPLESGKAIGRSLAESGPLWSGPGQEPPRDTCKDGGELDLIENSPGYMPYNGSEVRGLDGLPVHIS